MVCPKCGHGGKDKDAKEMKGKKPSVMIAIGIGKGKKMDAMKKGKK